MHNFNINQTIVQSELCMQKDCKSGGMLQINKFTIKMKQVQGKYAEYIIVEHLAPNLVYQLKIKRNQNEDIKYIYSYNYHDSNFS